MSNQRYAGPIRYGTNLTPHESAALDQHIEAAERLMRQRRVGVLREIDSERLTRCWCGAQVVNGHHCEDGHMQPRGVDVVLS